MNEPQFNVDIGGGMTIGPVDSKQLKQMARCGMIHADTRLEVVGRGWRTAGSIKGLTFGTPPSAAQTTAPAFSGAPSAPGAPSFPASAPPAPSMPMAPGAPMIPAVQPPPAAVPGITSSRIPADLVKMSPVMALVLMVVTCGIYHILWNMRVAKNINEIAGRQVAAPGLCGGLALCFGVGTVLLFLGVSKALPDLGRALGREQELASKASTVTILGILFPVLPIIWVQGWLNELHDRRAVA